MKCISILVSLLFANILALSAAEKFYEVTDNTSVFPLPYELPKFDGRSAESFDWDKYLKSAKSKADRSYRARLAYGHGRPVAGGGGSNSEDYERGILARDEFKAKCDDLIRRYREKLKPEPELLKALNDYVENSEAAIKLQAQLVGGSWGGSGAKVAWATSRMEAYINFYRNLQALGASLHLQDLPE